MHELLLAALLHQLGLLVAGLKFFVSLDSQFVLKRLLVSLLLLELSCAVFVGVLQVLEPLRLLGEHIFLPLKLLVERLPHLLLLAQDRRLFLGADLVPPLLLAILLLDLYAGAVDGWVTVRRDAILAYAVARMAHRIVAAANQRDGALVDATASLNTADNGATITAEVAPRIRAILVLLPELLRVKVVDILSLSQCRSQNTLLLGQRQVFEHLA